MFGELRERLMGKGGNQEDERGAQVFSVIRSWHVMGFTPSGDGDGRFWPGMCLCPCPFAQLCNYLGPCFRSNRVESIRVESS